MSRALLLLRLNQLAVEEFGLFKGECPPILFPAATRESISERPRGCELARTQVEDLAFFRLEELGHGTHA
eukprot:CAMPEP_0180682440 /NCGR_PEP_ID=MMETSP1037_2-20121125/70563_1 /TAXON_ID=632150 /ORGANISM="Azadinium spinosum, Strain 3D9" /LENGTH=69 /DNA_ID=CAMNT_0022712443 /DNA_START=62 /DNA_END=267 /DNA_ORIENTATION=-